MVFFAPPAAYPKKQKRQTTSNYHLPKVSSGPQICLPAALLFFSRCTAAEPTPACVWHTGEDCRAALFVQPYSNSASPACLPACHGSLAFVMLQVHEPCCSKPPLPPPPVSCATLAVASQSRLGGRPQPRSENIFSRTRLLVRQTGQSPWCIQPSVAHASATGEYVWEGALLLGRGPDLAMRSDLVYVAGAHGGHPG